MTENYLMWGKTSEFIKRYKLWRPGEIAISDNVDDIKSQEIFKKVHFCRLKFFEENGLLTVKLAEGDKWLDQEFYKNDFTAEGLSLIVKAERWGSTKGAKKDPPNMKILEKELAKIRSIKK